MAQPRHTQRKKETKKEWKGQTAIGGAGHSLPFCSTIERSRQACDIRRQVSVRHQGRDGFFFWLATRILGLISANLTILPFLARVKKRSGNPVIPIALKKDVSDSSSIFTPWLAAGMEHFRLKPQCRTANLNGTTTHRSSSSSTPWLA